MSLHEQRIRGVKRRKSNGSKSEEDKNAKLRRKLYHGLKELRKVVKKARTFEVQKTLKKLKDARRKDPEGNLTKELGAQLEILKRLSYDQLAHSAFMTKIKKDSTLSTNPSIQAISTDLASPLASPGAPGTPMAKVRSRILSSKVLASEVVSIMDALRAILYSVGSEGVEEATHGWSNTSKRRRVGPFHGNDGFSSRDNVVNPSGEGSGGGYEITNGDNAIVEHDDGWESGTVPSESGRSVAGSTGDHDYVTFDQGSSDEGGCPSQTHKSTNPWRHEPKVQSEKLPHLSVGFTRGDSESEFSDSEGKLVDGIKKNRRGQRARRAIWEKKFGKNANHIKKRQQQETARSSKRRLPDTLRADRRSAQRGLSSRPDRTSTRRVPTHGHEHVRRPTLAASPRAGAAREQPDRIRLGGHLRRNQVDRPLHPSWEAKRKQQPASIVLSQGSKIVFSEP